MCIYVPDANEVMAFKMCIHTGKNPAEPHQTDSLGQRVTRLVLPFNILPSELGG